MKEIILKVRYFGRSLSKSLKKVTSFLLPNLVHSNRQNYQKQKGPGTSYQSLLKITSYQVTKQIQKKSFISYVLSDHVWWRNAERFLSYSKNCICKFMRANLWHHKLIHFHLPFWIWKVLKGRKKITKLWISRERKELRWNKKHFS